MPHPHQFETPAVRVISEMPLSQIRSPNGTFLTTNSRRFPIPSSFPPSPTEMISAPKLPATARISWESVTMSSSTIPRMLWKCPSAPLPGRSSVIRWVGLNDPNSASRKPCLASSSSGSISGTALQPLAFIAAVSWSKEKRSVRALTSAPACSSAHAIFAVPLGPSVSPTAPPGIRTGNPVSRTALSAPLSDSLSFATGFGGTAARSPLLPGSLRMIRSRTSSFCFITSLSAAYIAIHPPH